MTDKQEEVLLSAIPWLDFAKSSRLFTSTENKLWLFLEEKNLFQSFNQWIDSFHLLVLKPSQIKVVSKGIELKKLKEELLLDAHETNLFMDCTRTFYPYKLAFDIKDKTYRRSLKRHGKEILSLIRQSFQLSCELNEENPHNLLQEKPSFQLGDPSISPEILVQCDGSVRPSGSGCGFVIKSLENPNKPIVKIRGSVPTEFKNSLKAEWQALIFALKTAKSIGAKSIRVHVDAMGLCDLLNGKAKLSWSVEEAELIKAACEFDNIEVVKVPRVFNYEADRLAYKAAL